MINNPTQPNLEDFVDKLIDERQFTDLLPEVKDQMKKDIITRLVDTINAKAIAELSDEALDEFEKLLKSNTPQPQIQQFIETKIPDSVSFLTNVLSDFRKTYLGIA